jgi:hypothetical protein
VRISTAGGRLPRWRGDSRELYYLGLDQSLRAVELDGAGGSLKASAPKALFRTALPVGSSSNYQYDVTADGQKFLINAPVEQDAEPITIYANWIEALKK